MAECLLSQAEKFASSHKRIKVLMLLRLEVQVFKGTYEQFVGFLCTEIISFDILI